MGPPFLLRFLKYNKFNLEKSIKQLISAKTWRIENHIDNIYEFKLPEINELRKAYPFCYHKTDKKGRPIYIEKTNLIDMKQVLKVSSVDRFIKYSLRDYEVMIREVFPLCTKMSGHPVEGITMIMDFGGLTNPMSGELHELSKKLMKLEEQFYPKVMERYLLCINEKKDYL